MIYPACDLGIEIDFGNDKSGTILQCKEKGCWHDCLVDVETLVPGFYRLRDPA